MVQKSVKIVKRLFYDDESFLSKSDFEKKDLVWRKYVLCNIISPLVMFQSL